MSIVKGHATRQTAGADGQQGLVVRIVGIPDATMRPFVHLVLHAWPRARNATVLKGEGLSNVTMEIYAQFQAVKRQHTLSRVHELQTLLCHIRQRPTCLFITAAATVCLASRGDGHVVRMAINAPVFAVLLL